MLLLDVAGPILVGVTSAYLALMMRPLRGG